MSAGEIRVTAPSLHFLTGKSLSRLHDGAAVPFDFQLIITAGSKNNVVARSLERFTVSYDVWEEKFSVVRVRDFRTLGHAPFRRRAPNPGAWTISVIPAAESASRTSNSGRAWKSAAPNPKNLLARQRFRHQSGHSDRDLQPAFASPAGSLVGGIRAVSAGRPEAIAMNRLRNRLILVFVVATLAPLCLIGWISVRLLHYSLALAPTPRAGSGFAVARKDRA